MTRHANLRRRPLLCQGGAHRRRTTHLPRKDEVLSARGRSLGGFSTWNHLRADQHGQPLAFVLNPGKAANRGAMKALMEAMAMPSRTLDGHEFRARNLRTEKSQQPLGIAG